MYTLFEYLLFPCLVFISVVVCLFVCLVREYLVCFVDFVVVVVVAILFSVCVYFVVIAVVAILFICLSVSLWSVDLFFFWLALS